MKKKFRILSLLGLVLLFGIFCFAGINAQTVKAEEVVEEETVQEEPTTPEGETPAEGTGEGGTGQGGTGEDQPVTKNALTIDSETGIYTDDRKNEDYINPYFSYIPAGGEELAIGTIINTVNFSFNGIEDGAKIILVIEGKYADETYGLVNKVNVTGTTGYKRAFTLGGDYRAYLTDFDGTQIGEEVEFSIAIPQTEHGDDDPARRWDFINYFSDQVLAGETIIDFSEYKIRRWDYDEDGKLTWETWNNLYKLKDWQYASSSVNYTCEYETIEGVEYLKTMSINAYFGRVDYDVPGNVIFDSFSTYAKRLVDTLIDRPMTDLEKVTILYNYFCEYIGNIYGDASSPIGSLWDREALCDGCAKGFQMLCDLAGVNCIKGGSGVSQHAWNIVEVDGNWYHVDPLWGINNPSAYFLRTDKEFILHHNGTADMYKKYGTSQIYWAHTLTDAFPPAEDERFVEGGDVEYIFRKATGQLYYDTDKKVYYYYILKDGVYTVYTSPTLEYNEDTVKNLGTVATLNDFYELAIPSPEEFLYLDLSAETVEVGDMLYMSTGAYYYTNILDTTDAKYDCMNVRPSLAGLGVTADYVYEIFDANDELLATIQGAMYYINPVSFNTAGEYTIKVTCTGANGKKGSISKKVKVTGDDDEKADSAVNDPVRNAREGRIITLWAGGSKTTKTAEVKTTLTAKNWTTTAGKSKKGKLSWVASSTVPVFDETGHKLTTKSEKTIVTVSNKGKVTAKSGGETGETQTSIYACDTGSLSTDKYTIIVKNAPTSITLSKTLGSVAKEDKLKKVSINAGSNQLVYIVGTSKLGAVSKDCTYTVEADKNSGYISVSDIATDDNGNSYFYIEGLKSGENGKAAKVKLTVTSDQSGKKATLTVQVAAGVTAVKSESNKTAMTTKGDEAKLTLTPTIAGGATTTTDKAKVYVTTAAPQINEKKVTISKGTLVAAKLDKSGKSVELTAKDDVNAEQFVYIVYTDSLTKLPEVFLLATISATGEITTP